MSQPDIVLSYADFIDEWSEVSEKPIFYSGGVCPHCRVDAPVVRYSDNPEVSSVGIAQSLWVRSCPCGWWEIERLGVLGPDIGYDSESYSWAHANKWYRHGVLRSFSIEDHDVPIIALRQALSRYSHLVHSIHSRKMEELVASVMSDFFGGCEVDLCGKTGDGGIDLLMIVCETPKAVQVKRRTNAESVEGVSSIREFLAAMQLRGITQGVYVTTADHFSRPAKKTASRAVTLDLVTSFELLDRHRFFDMLRATAPAIATKNWEPQTTFAPWGSR